MPGKALNVVPPMPGDMYAIPGNKRIGVVWEVEGGLVRGARMGTWSITRTKCQRWISTDHLKRPLT